MFPTLSHFIDSLFGIHVPLPFNTFGVFVALASIAGYWAFTKEFKRKEALGIIHPIKKTVIMGKPASMIEIVSHAVMGFLIGYKLVYALLNYKLFVSDVQTVLVSSKGDIFGGLFFAGLFAYWVYWEKNKFKLDQPETVEVTQYPHELMGTMIFWAMVWGFVGAKIFADLEHWDSFIADPVNSLLSFSGLTLPGGLIGGGAAVFYMASKNGIKVKHMFDIGAPGMMLAYSVGRMGCHMSGDGDWGTINLSTKPVSWLPDWFWAYTYPNNVANEGVPIPGCIGRFCNELFYPVYPTALYDAIACFLLFLVLWKLRHHVKLPRLMFGIYVMMIGVERFFIELIRVHATYTIAGIQFTQTGLISCLLFVCGLFLVLSAVFAEKNVYGLSPNYNRTS